MPAHRRTDAVFAALLWVIGGELMPLAHVVMHDDLAEHTHVHADGEEHADHDGHHDDVPADATTDDAPTGWHGEGSLAHHDAMIAFGGIALPHVPAARLGVAPPTRGPWTPGDHAPAEETNARGPPRV